MTSRPLTIWLVASAVAMLAGAVGFGVMLSSEPSASRDVWMALWASLMSVGGSVAAQGVWWFGTHQTATLPPTLIRRRMASVLSCALALSCVLPLNWLAHEHEQVLDLSSLTQVSPGEDTQRALDRLPGRLRVTAFLPPTSDLVPVLRAYFTQLDTASFEAIDQRSYPEEARRLGVRDNGTMVLEYVSSPDSAPAVKRLDIGLSRGQARQAVSELDDTLFMQITSLSSARRTVYVLQGHDELSIEGQRSGGPASFSRGRELLEKRLNLSVKPLSLFEGGLTRVPADAGVVLVLGPLREVSAQQVAVLTDYLEGGGALLLAHEPGQHVGAFAPLHERLLVRVQPVPLATSSPAVLLTRTRLDRYNIVTRDWVNHPATSSFRDPRESLSVLLPSTGHIEELAAPGGVREVFVEPLLGSPSASWEDLDGNYDYDAQSEYRARRILSIAARPSGRAGEDEPTWRAIIMSDSTVFSDLVLARSLGNEALLLDHVSWLLEDTTSPGLATQRGNRTLDLLGGPDRHLVLGALAGSPLLFLLLFGFARRRMRRR